MKKFSDRLRHIRLLRRYTQAELAQRAGLSQSAVASYESGERQSSRAIFKLAAALRVEAQWLDTGKGPMTRTEESLYNSLAPADSSNRYALMETQRDATRNSPTPSGWPFARILRSHYDDLTPHHQQLLENLIATFLEACQTTELSTFSGRKSRLHE